MSVHLFDCPIAGTPPEPLLLEALTIRLIEDSERQHFDEELAAKHYLKDGPVVGQVLRYVAEYHRQWVGLLVFSSAAFHIKVREQWLGWSARQVKERRHLIAQNSRFLVLAAPGRWPAAFGGPPNAFAPPPSSHYLVRETRSTGSRRRAGDDDTRAACAPHLC